MPALYQGRDVFVIGSGFSKAICPDSMPTLDELGRRIAEKLVTRPSFHLLPASVQAALANHHIPTGSFEVWLSHLATRAPFLDEADRLHNAAIAQELTALIVDEVQQSVAATLSQPMPHWLGRLVTLWDRTAATVVTFNYDTLIEQAADAAHYPWILSPIESVVAGFSFTLLKMHGSMNWWWIPTDRVGNTVTPADMPGAWGKPETPERLGGMVPFVVPPLASKSDYYDLSIVRETWQLARSALATPAVSSSWAIRPHLPI